MTREGFHTEQQASARRSMVLSSVLTMILLLASAFNVPFVGTSVADGDGNDDFGNAEQLPVNGTAFGTVNGTGDSHDYYKLSVQGDLIEVLAQSLQSSNGTLSVTLFDPFQNQIRVMNDLSPGASGTLRYLTSIENSGEYYVVASESMGKNTTYRIQVNLTPQDDAGTGGDAPGDGGTPPTIQPGDDHHGELNDIDNQDMYLFNVAQGSYLLVELNTLDNGPIRMSIKDQSDMINYGSPDVQSGEDLLYEMLFREDLGGDLTIGFEGCGNYSFSIAVSPQNDTGDDKDAPEQFPGMENMDLNDTIEGTIGSLDDQDNYRFTMAHGDGFLLNVSHDHDAGNLGLKLLDDQGNQVGDHFDIGPGQVLEISFWSDIDDMVDISGLVLGHNSITERVNYTIRIVHLEQDDAGTGSDVTGSQQSGTNPHLLPAGNTTFDGGVGAGSVDTFGGGGDMMDRYSMVVPPYNNLTVRGTSTTPGASISFHIWTEDYWVDQTLNFGETDPLDMTWSTDGITRTFILELSTGQGSRGDYSMEIEMDDVPDTTPPMMYMDQPLPDTVQDPNIWFTVTVSDDRGMDHVEVILNENETLQCEDSGMDQWSCSFVLDPGMNTVEVRAIDLVGNVANETFFSDYHIEDLFLNIEEPFDGQEYDHDMITVRGRLSGWMGTEVVQMSMDGGNSWMDAKMEGDMWNLDVHLAPGENEIIIWARDDMGREDRQTRNVTYRDDGNGNGNGGSNGNGTGNGNGGGNGDNGGDGGLGNIEEFMFVMGASYCLSPIILGLFIGGIFAGLLPLALGLRFGIRRGRKKRAMERLEEEEEDVVYEEVA